MSRVGAESAAREMLRVGYTRDYLRLRGLDEGELRIVNSGDVLAVQLRSSGCHFYQRLDDLDFSNPSSAIAAVEGCATRLTSRAKHYLRRTPRCYYPRFAEEDK